MHPVASVVVSVVQSSSPCNHESMVLELRTSKEAVELVASFSVFNLSRAVPLIARFVDAFFYLSGNYFTVWKRFT